MIITVLSFAYSTFAFFTDSTDSRYNALAAGTASVELVDVTYQPGGNVTVTPGEAIRILPGYEVKKTVGAKNTGSVPLYIRVKINLDITLAGNAIGREAEIDTSLVGYNINEEKWFLHTDGYYYYRTALVHDKETEPLFTTVKFSEKMGNLYKDSTITFKLNMEAVQANNNGTSPIDANYWSTPIKVGGDS